MNVKGLMMTEHISTYYFVAGDYIKDRFFTLNRFLKSASGKNIKNQHLAFIQLL